MTQSDFGGANAKPGQPQIYVGTENAPGGGKRLLFVHIHQRVPLHIAISRQDYDTLIRDGTPVPTEPAIGPMNCPMCNHSITPRSTGNEDEVECPGCEHRWNLCYPV